MKLSPKSRRNLLRILPTGIIWLVFGLIYALLEKGLMGDLKYYPTTGNPYNFQNLIFPFAVMVFISGNLMGTFEVLYLSKRFTESRLYQKFLLKTAIYLALICLFLVVIAAITNALELDVPVWDRQVGNNIIAFVSSFAFLSAMIFVASIILVTLFYTEVSENIGYEVLANFLTGKYHRPIQEERVFMFLDMKSSTTIAENIGHYKYFEMLKKYYSDLSGPVVDHMGEIYQYVGDEVIVSWRPGKGITDNNCLDCFFAMKNVIHQRREEYRASFGLVPEFKAGMHIGKVTAGEIGKIKKEIIFTGDVLNATARIQGLCNHLEQELLISGQLVDQLDKGAFYRFRALGDQSLRGREGKMALYTVVEQ